MTAENSTPLKDRAVVITGASSGIGAAIARRLLDDGAKVALLARREDRLQALAADYPEGRALPITVDLRDEASIQAAFETARGALGGIDALVNNAGLGYVAPLLEPGAAQWREILEVNVLALAICTQLACADMEARGVAGHIVHISSMSAHRVPPGSGMYSASKYAVRSLTEGLRTELRERGSKIRISSLSPGYVVTEFHAGFFGDASKAEKLYSQFPMLQAEDMARAVHFILTQPEHVQIHDMLVRATEQSS